MSSHLATTDDGLGGRIRTLRLSRTLTIESLAALTGVSRAMLSRIERGESSPTAQLLARICGGLGVTLSTLFAEATDAAEPLVRQSDQQVWRDPATGYRRRTVSPPGTGSLVHIAEITFPPGTSVLLDNTSLVAADQHLWMLDGTLELTIGDETFRLERGDCLRMVFTAPVRFHNPTARSVRYAVVVCQGRSQP